jgi:hypothetical protein
VRRLVTVTLGVLPLASGSAHAQGVVLPLPRGDQLKVAAVLGQGVVAAIWSTFPSSRSTLDPHAAWR